MFNPVAMEVGAEGKADEEEEDEGVLEYNPMMPYAEELMERGVTVIPVIPTLSERKTMHNNFWNAVRQFPEYKDPEAKDTVFVLGGFGALGNPASFHNPFVRSLRQRMMFEAVPLFSALEDLNLLEGRLFMKRQLAQLFDRMSIRRKGTSTSKESWHRDESPIENSGLEGILGDEVFGGWINLDTTQTQYFSCVPGSHVGGRQAGEESGFCRLSEADAKQFAVDAKTIEVPPGHWIVFYQHIVHEVVSRKMTYDSIRLFLGWHLTWSDDPLFDVLPVMEDQGVAKLPSGQAPPMYSLNHGSFFVDSTSEWSIETFKEQCLVEKERKRDRHRYWMVDRIMKSLVQYDLPLYAAYTDAELDIMLPNLDWTLPVRSVVSGKQRRLFKTLQM